MTDRKLTMWPNRDGCWRCQWSSYNTRTDSSQTLSLTHSLTGHRMYWPSHGYGGVRLSRPVAYDVLQLSGVWDVVARLVLSQDLHQRTQLQPPLLLRDPVTADGRGNLSTVLTASFLLHTYTNVFIIMLWNLICSNEWGAVKRSIPIWTTWVCDARVTLNDKTGISDDRSVLT